MTKARKTRVNRVCAVIIIILAMIGSTIGAYYLGIASMTPQKITITDDEIVIVYTEKGHIYEYAPKIQGVSNIK